MVVPRFSWGPPLFVRLRRRQISGCRDVFLLIPVCLVCPWAAARPLAVRAASFARRVVSEPGQALPPPTGTAAGPRRPRSGLRLGGADPISARPCRCPRAPQPGPAGLVAASDQAALILFRPGPAAVHGHRSRAPQASQRPPIRRPLALQEIRRGPAQKRIRAGPLLLALTRQRVSSLLGRCTRRSTPRRRWGGSSRAGWPGADST